MRMKTKLLSLALFSFVLLSGFSCPPGNNTGLGSCLLGNSGTGCVGQAPPSTVQQLEAEGRGGFDVYTEFEVTTSALIVLDFRADAINGVSGTYYTASGATYGTETSFGPETSGDQIGTAPPGVTLNSGLIISNDGKAPAQWFFKWGVAGTGYNSQWAGYVQKTFGPLVDENGKNWPQWCNGGGYVALTSVNVAESIPFSCLIHACDCVPVMGAATPSTVVQPVTLEAGNLVNLTITPLTPPSGGFVASQTGIYIYDAAGTTQNCFGYNGACRALTVGGTGNKQITLPAGWYAYADDEEPGDYYGQIQTLVNGSWKNGDKFGFSITRGGQPVFRSYSPSHNTHYWSQARDEGSIWPYDYRYEGVGFYIYPVGSKQIYGGYGAEFFRDSCCTGGGNGAWLLTDSSVEHTNAENAGWIPNYYLGFIMTTQNTYCGNISPCFTPDAPLYRTWIQTNGNANFMYTTSYTEYQNMLHSGWSSQGIQGYVPTGP